METKVEFQLPIEEEHNVESITSRFSSDYPNSTNEVVVDNDEETISVLFTSEDIIELNDVDTFLCEEICNEFGAYCFIYNSDGRKEYYYDEEDEWFDR